MTDRARLVYALLRTLLAWAPTPRSRTGLDLAPRGFAGGDLRYVVCPDCLANDRLHGGIPGCETCNGRGEIPDPGKDPYDTGKARGIFAGRSALVHRAVGDDDRKRATRERDLELQRLDQQLARPERREDELAIDPLTTAIELRDRLDKTGDYGKLRVALEQLRHEQPIAHQVAMWVAYAPLHEEPIDAVRESVVKVCEILALRIDGPIRVPAFVSISADAEIERLARDGKGALWRGQAPGTTLRRHERNTLIAAMAAEGKSATAIGLRFNLTRKRVQQIIAEQAMVDVAVASGPAA